MPLAVTFGTIAIALAYRGALALVGDVGLAYWHVRRFIIEGRERVARYEAHEAEQARRRDRRIAGLLAIVDDSNGGPVRYADLGDGRIIVRPKAS